VIEGRREHRVVEYLDRLVTAIEGQRPGPVVIMTGQMGMVPYHLAMKHPRSIRFAQPLVEKRFKKPPVNFQRA